MRQENNPVWLFLAKAGHELARVQGKGLAKNMPLWSQNTPCDIYNVRLFVALRTYEERSDERKCELWNSNFIKSTDIIPGIESLHGSQKI